MPKPYRKNSQRSPDDAPEQRGPRPTWRGSLSFGLVTVPVELHSASRAPALRAHTVGEDGVRLYRRYYCPRDDRDLESDELVRGFELPNGKHVVVDDDELAALAPKKSREIDLRSFTARENLHPSLFENPYVLAPARDNSAGKAYRLLVRVMHARKKAGIATFVLREREYLIAIVSDGRLLLGQTLRFADELRSPEDVGLPEVEEADAKLVAKLSQALEAEGKGRFDANDLVDPGHEKLAKLLEAKRKKGEVVEPPETESDEATAAGDAEGGEVIDLMRLLKQSLQGTEGGKGKQSNDNAGKTRSRERPKPTGSDTRTRRASSTSERRKAGKSSARRRAS
ncbi:MAG: Ku protein [Polyangiales bacterium]